MVRISLPDSTEGPVTVHTTRRRSRLTEVSSSPPVPRTTSPGAPVAADESRYPRASAALAALAAYTATVSSSLLLLPLSRAKLFAHLPLRIAPKSAFAGAHATLAEAGATLAATALLPQPVSALVSYAASVPLRAAALRTQAGSFVAARAFKSGVWKAHMLRDAPFLVVETCVLAALVLGRARARSVRDMEKLQRGDPVPLNSLGKRERRGGIETQDAVFAGGVAGLVTVPLDFVRTRLLISGKPSVMRTVKGVMRLGTRRGFEPFLARRSAGASMYVADCMVRPVARVVVYAVVRATLVSAWLKWKMEKEAKASKDAYVIEAQPGSKGEKHK